MLRRLLVVDDDATNLHLLRKILSDDYDLVEARDGKQALEKLRGHHEEISAVLLDLIMPVMDGYELLKIMQDDALLSRIPVLVCTVAGSEEAEVKALSLGASDFLLKPYRPAVIKKRLSLIIRYHETTSLLRIAAKDKLTGLPNREAFFDAVEGMIASQEPSYYVLSCIDIDNFKVINDQYGSVKGDEVLRHVADTIAEGFLPLGGVCSRISADNFAILYPRDVIDSPELADIRRAMLTPGGDLPPVTFRVGRCVIDDPSLPVSALYDRAALAEASIRGRFDEHVAYYDESMRARLLHEQGIINEMNGALKGNQFEVWFQPQYNHATGALIGAEALVRWRHPEKGLIAPYEFIPVFERNGFIYELDKFVWRRCCQLLRGWIDAGRSPLPVSVNISRYDVFREDLVDVVTGLIGEYRIPVDLLRLEITESAFAKSTEQIIGVVQNLTDLGFTVEIDDFGSGYSSLNTLKDVPAGILKLDMKFLEDTSNSRRGGNILESIVRMAKWLDMSVIAEGVETREQADFLLSIGCNYIQGYLYARPMPVEQYEALAKATVKEQRLLALETVEMLDNNAFWDPKSMDTLIFSSYVGGACIFEYRGGVIEMLRANNKYAKTLGGDGGTITIDEALRIAWFDHLDEENKKSFLDGIEMAIDTRDEVSYEIKLTHLPGCAEITYLRASLRMIASTGDRFLMYCMNENITAQREAEQKEHETTEQLRAITNNINGGVTAIVMQDGAPRFLFANNQYFEQLGYTKEQFESEVQNAFDLIHADDRARVAGVTDEASKRRVPFSVSYRAICRDGSIKWMHSSISIIDYPMISQPVQLAVANDITEQKNASEQLRATDEQLRFLNGMAHDLLAQPDIIEGIERVLKKLLAYFGGKRAYIFEFDDANKTSNNTFEICADGVSRQIDYLQNVPMEAMTFWLGAFDQKTYVRIDDVDQLDESREAEKRTLQAQGIKSLIAVPLRRDGALIGFIGIDDPSREQTRIDRLDAIGDFIAVMLTRRDLNAKIESDNRALLGLMNDTPGGFARIRAFRDGRAIAEFVNKGFCDLLGMTVEEVMARYREDALWNIHPDDLPGVRDTIRHLIDEGGTHVSRFRLQQKSGAYKNLMVFGRAADFTPDSVCLNVYYTDVSELDHIEDQRRDLIENLPCGAGMYEINAGVISVVYINRRYRDMIGRDPMNERDVSVFDAVHPQDREKLRAALEGNLAHGRRIDCDIRILNGSGDFLPFRLSGNTVVKENGATILYTTYTPISEHEITFRNMLPVALAAMMKASPDIAFVKDKNLTYICCSAVFARMAGLKDESEIVGKTDYDILDHALADRYVAADREIIESRQSKTNYIDRLPSEDGVVHYGDTSKYLLYDAFGEVIGIYGVGRDVTEERAAYARLKLLTESIPGGLATYECTKDGVRVIYFNDTFCRLIGYTREEYERLARLSSSSLILPDDLPLFKSQIDKILHSGEPIDCVFRVRAKDGRVLYVNMKGALSDRHGDTAIINAAMYDVTAQREAEEQLRINNEEIKLAMSQMGKMILLYDVRAGTLTMPEAYARKHGQPSVLHNVPRVMTEQDMLESEDIAGYVAFYNAIRRGEKQGVSEARIACSDGTRTWEHAEFVNIFNSAGEPVKAIISVEDITAQHRKDKEIHDEILLEVQRAREYEQLFFDAAAGRFAGIIRIDLDTENAYRVDFVDDSPSVHPIEGTWLDYYNRFLDDIHPDDRAMANARMAGGHLSDMSPGASVSVTYRSRVKTAAYRWYTTTIRISSDVVVSPRAEKESALRSATMFSVDIDDEVVERARLKDLSEHDGLTDLFNRVKFEAMMEKEYKSLSSCGVLFFDVNYLKETNDLMGHQSGDRLLASWPTAFARSPTAAYTAIATAATNSSSLRAIAPKKSWIKCCSCGARA